MKMKINTETQVVIDKHEYNRLVRLEGAVEALQRLLDNSGYGITVEDIAAILDLEMDAYNKRQCEMSERYRALIQEKEETENE